MPAIPDVTGKPQNTSENQIVCKKTGEGAIHLHFGGIVAPARPVSSVNEIYMYLLLRITMKFGREGLFPFGYGKCNIAGEVGKGKS